MPIDVVISGASPLFTCSVDALDTAPTVTATGPTARAATESARVLAQAQVVGQLRAAGVVITPQRLAALEWRLRAACSGALYAATHTPPIYPTPALFGSDVSTFSGPSGRDLDPTLAALTGQRIVAEAVARRWLTPHGLMPADPDSGTDVRELLGEGFTPGRVNLLRAQLEAEAEKDERVLSAAVSVALTTSTQTLSIKGQIQTAAGPFALVLDVSQVAASLTVLDTVG